MRKTLIAVAMLLAATAANAAVSNLGPSTTNNDDSCDIGVFPAATLLIPYFEVANENQATAVTTLFTITNTTRTPQIAHVTLWTDWGFPVLGFNIFLTGYDVQAINLYDVVVRGIIAPPNGTSNKAATGSRSLDNDENPNFLGSAASLCSQGVGTIPASLLDDVQDALRNGTTDACGNTRIGNQHSLLIGYATIDVVATCTTSGPAAASYFRDEILFDNVLLGDYQTLNPNPASGNYAGGNPMVHIRAVPEGGKAGTVGNSSLPYTFYDRYTNGAGTNVPRTVDRRQPLPSTFAARFIQGGTGAFNTDYKIWREGTVAASTNCASYASNNNMLVSDIVRFDERENPTTTATGSLGTFPATSRIATASSLFPPLSNAGDVAGWMYLNLNNRGSNAYSVTVNGLSDSTPPTLRDFRTNTSTTTGVRQSQNWVTVWMTAEGRFGTETDAGQLANGCSPAPALTSGQNAIGPGTNVTP